MSKKVNNCKKCGNKDVKINNCGYSTFNDGSAKCEKCKKGDSMNVKKEDIIKLRKISGQSIMDCKKALEQTDNLDEAFKFLRKNTFEKINNKRKHKSLNEGRVVVKCSYDHPVPGSIIALVSLLCETDFTAKSKLFIEALDNISTLLTSGITPQMTEVTEIVNSIQAQTGEKIELDEAYIMPIEDNTPTMFYTHFDNKKAAIVQFNANSNPYHLQKLGHNIAMHIVGNKPEYLNDEDFINDTAKDIPIPSDTHKKSPEMQQKIILGALNKAKKERVLLHQPYCLDNTISVDQAIKNIRKELMMEISLKQFKHTEIGD